MSTMRTTRDAGISRRDSDRNPKVRLMARTISQQESAQYLGGAPRSGRAAG